LLLRERAARAAELEAEIAMLRERAAARAPALLSSSSSSSSLPPPPPAAATSPTAQQLQFGAPPSPAAPPFVRSPPPSGASLAVAALGEAEFGGPGGPGAALGGGLAFELAQAVGAQQAQLQELTLRLVHALQRDVAELQARATPARRTGAGAGERGA